MLMKTTKPLSKSYFIHPDVKSMLDKAKNQVMKHDWDRVYIIDGSEGSGKSLLGLQLGSYLDPTLNLERVVFSGNQFSQAIKQADKNQCIIFDEAFNGLDSGGAATKMNKLLVKNLMECRQKNLFIIIILPTIFLLNKYAAIFRSKCLFHVFVSKKGARGNYKVYNTKNKKLLYIMGKKLYSYSKPHIFKTFNFRGKYPVNEEEYRKKKLVSLEEEFEQEKLDKYAIRFALICKLVKEKLKMNYRDQIKYLESYNWGLDSTRLSHLMAKIPPKVQGNEK